MTTLKTLRQWSVLQTLTMPTNLENALFELGFVQADPIRAPARAQDLILRPRVEGYRANTLEHQYADLPINEDYFVNYGFLHQRTLPLLHPRHSSTFKIEQDAPDLLPEVLEYVRQNPLSHPKQLEAHFDKQRVRNAWGGSSNATTRALEALHYQGHLRVSRREKGIKLYELAKPQQNHLSDETRAEGLLALILQNYAPLPLSSLMQLCSFCRYGAPSLAKTVRMLAQKLETVHIEGIKWVLPMAVPTAEPRDDVTLLAPFDPIVWDRRRFALLHGWEYRFEAYTKPEKRLRGYYALPLLYRTEIIGWANIQKTKNHEFLAEIGYIHQPKTKHFQQSLANELEQMEWFLAKG